MGLMADCTAAQVNRVSGLRVPSSSGVLRNVAPSSFLLPSQQSRNRGRCSTSGRRNICIRADLSDQVKGIVAQGNKVVDSATDLLPGSVPRPLAKVGVLSVGGLVAFWLVGKVVSTVLFFGVLGGVLYLWFKAGDDNSGGGGGGSSSKSRSSSDSDPLREAQKIMDKYK